MGAPLAAMKDALCSGHSDARERPVCTGMQCNEMAPGAGTELLILPCRVAFKVGRERREKKKNQIKELPSG